MCMCMCMCMCTYMYVYVYVYPYTHTPLSQFGPPKPAPHPAARLCLRWGSFSDK